MERALIVHEESHSTEPLLREAATLAAGVDAELVILSLVTPEELDQDLETLETIADIEHTDYGADTVLQSAVVATEEHAGDVIGDVDVEYTAVASIADDGVASTIIETAVQNDCDHVFLAGRKRSPTGKVLFGDVAQSVLLNFEGRVTVELS
ncbi:universal stress protein [Natrialbaceae archaeon A-CW1-1]